MNWIQLVLLILSVVISIGSLVIVYTYRKKDFQNTILKEQIAIYTSLLDNLFDTTESLNALYEKKIADKWMTAEGFDLAENLESHHKKLFDDFSPEYDRSFNRFQKQIFLLPEDVIDATTAYYNFLYDLFDKNNDEYLGVKLLGELHQKIFDVISVIRNHIAVDDLSEATRKLLTKRGQLQFAKEEDSRKQ